MNEMITTTTKTPIEIALGVDENGMTTARKLYEFLELNPSNYSKWVKRNITENEFASEGEDFHSYQMTSERRGNFADDYKLTSDFAKKLSMTAKNEKGEQARDYFVKVENIAKDTVLQLDGLSTEMKAILLHDRKLVEQESRLKRLEDTNGLDSNQRKKIRSAIHKAVAKACGGKKTQAYLEHSKKVYSALYSFLYEYYNVAEYADIPKIKYEEAKAEIEEWYPDYELNQKIKKANFDND